MFETTFRNLDDALRKDAGCSSELDYIELAGWGRSCFEVIPAKEAIRGL